MKRETRKSENNIQQIKDIALDVRRFANEKVAGGYGEWGEAGNMARRVRDGKKNQEDLVKCLAEIKNNPDAARFIEMLKEAAVVDLPQLSVPEPTSKGSITDTLSETEGETSDESAQESDREQSTSQSVCTGVEDVDINDIEIDPEAAALFERSPAVVESLRASMVKNGFLRYHPIKVWDRGNGRYAPYDGHTRIEVALGLDKKPEHLPAVKVHFPSREEFLQAVVDEQVGRRNLSIRDKFAVVRYYAPIEAAKARGRHGGKGQSAGNPADLEAGRADTILGRKVGLSADTVAKISALIESGSVKLLEKVYSGELSINAAHKRLPKPDKESSAGERAAGAKDEKAGEDMGATEGEASSGDKAKTETPGSGSKPKKNKKRKTEKPSGAKEDKHVPSSSEVGWLDEPDKAPAGNTSEEAALLSLLELLVPHFPAERRQEMEMALARCSVQVRTIVSKAISGVIAA